jgi:penicillin amidase
MRQKFLILANILSAFLLTASFAQQNNLGTATSAQVTRASEKNIEILRDKWEIPHIFSTSDTSAMYGLGYVTAQDRAFQMFYNLRIIQGRLAEVIGDVPKNNRQDTSVQSDRKMRTFGFYRAVQEVAKNIDSQTYKLLEAYCEGVNDYIKNNPDKLSPMFSRYNLKPDAWTPADCIVSWWHVGQFFGTDGTRELIAWRNQTNPPQRATDRNARNIQTRRPARQPNTRPDDSAAVIQRTDVSQEWIDKVNNYIKAHGFDIQPQQSSDNTTESPKFSHAWVIGKNKTSTGSAILMSDPQTPVTNPSLFYEYHIKGETFNVRGIGVPGSPLILIGFSDHVAWGVTALGADQADMFRLKTSQDKPDQYSIDGQWKPMKVWQETIHVKGGRDQSITIRETDFGPVITEFAFVQPQDGQVAVKRIPICETDRDTIQGAFAMMRARNVNEFDKALEGWRFPSINILFGDKEGNIGYRTALAQPLRSPGVTDLGIAQDGSAAKNDWQGIVPHDLLPHVINPKNGFLFSANHRPIGSFYNIPLGNSTGSLGDTVRSRRLRELIIGKDSFTPEDVLNIHNDTVDPSRRDIVTLGYYIRDKQKAELSEAALEALKYLESWHERGSHMDNRIRGTALASNIDTMFRIGNTELAADYGGGQTGLCRFLSSMTRRIEQDSQASLDEREIQYIDSVLSNAWRTTQRLGRDAEQWTSLYQRSITRQKLLFHGSLDGFSSLDGQFDIEKPALYCTDGDTILSQQSQSYTQFVPMNNPDLAMTILPVGESEIPGSAGYADLKDDWAQGKLHPAPLTREAVDKITKNKITLSR